MQNLTMTEFKQLVRRIMETLPKEFYPHLENLVVDVLEEPDEELLLSAGFTEGEIEEGEGLMGLFEPMDFSLSTEGLEVGELMNRLWIFKKPHEEEFPDLKEMCIEIRRTVIHELAHHFGYSERDLDYFESQKDPFGDNWNYFHDFPQKGT
jgi:predicted Zn-dependent protease with MMP-like domain